VAQFGRNYPLPFSDTAALAKCLNKLGNEPVLVSDLDGELVILRQFFQEWPETSKELAAISHSSAEEE